MCPRKYRLKTKIQPIEESAALKLETQELELSASNHAQVEEALQINRAIVNSIINGTSDAIYAKDLHGRYILFNAAAERLMGHSESDVLGKDDYLFFPKAEVAVIMENDRKVIEEGIVKTYEENGTIFSGPKTVLSTKGPLVDKKGNIIGIYGITRDITESKMAEDALRKSELRYRELSIIDDLTQLHNSRHFHAQLEIEIERSNRYGQPLTLLLLDLDKFKKFNDKYGHIEGDNVLSRLGHVIKRCLRDPDSAYRYGGEEFTIMLPMTTGEEGIVTAKRIQTELRKEAFSPESDKKFNMTISIGIAQYKPLEDMKTFVRRADKLMYQAKKEGRDRICPDRIEHKQKSIIGST
jgi:two-component system, cell cycle response regulator